MSEQSRMRSRHLGVVRLARDRRQHLRDIAFPRFPAPAVPELDTEEKLRDGHGRHSHVVVVAHQVVERSTVPLGVDRDGRIED